MRSSRGLISLFVALTFVLAGCSPVQEPIESSEKADSWACKSMDGIFASLGNSPSEALEFLSGEAEYFPLLSSTSPALESVSAYYESLRLLISDNPNAENLLNIITSQPKAGFQRNLEFHRDMRGFCESIDYTLWDDDLLTAEWSGGKSKPEDKKGPKPDEAITADGAKCLRNMELASLEPDSTLAEKYLKNTAEYCSGAVTWYVALFLFPYAMGFSTVGGGELEILCRRYPMTNACQND